MRHLNAILPCRFVSPRVLQIPVRASNLRLHRRILELVISLHPICILRKSSAHSFCQQPRACILRPAHRPVGCDRLLPVPVKVDVLAPGVPLPRRQPAAARSGVSAHRAHDRRTPWIQPVLALPSALVVHATPLCSTTLRAVRDLNILLCDRALVRDYHAQTHRLRGRPSPASALGRRPRVVSCYRRKRWSSVCLLRGSSRRSPTCRLSCRCSAVRR